MDYSSKVISKKILALFTKCITDVFKKKSVFQEDTKVETLFVSWGDEKVKFKLIFWFHSDEIRIPEYMEIKIIMDFCFYTKDGLIEMPHYKIEVKNTWIDQKENFPNINFSSLMNNLQAKLSTDANREKFSRAYRVR